MRKTQSYQEPSTQAVEVRNSDVSNSHQFDRSVRFSLGESLQALPYKQPHQGQPLFDLKGSNVNNKPPTKNSRVARVSERNTPKDQNAQTFRAICQKQQQLSSRMLRSDGTQKQEPISYRPSYGYGFLRKSEQFARTPLEEGTLLPRLTNKGDRQGVDAASPYQLMFGYRSLKGSCATNPDKVNQDSCIINLNIQKNQQVHFFGVCDGHGPFGHHVSGFLKNHLNEANKSFSSKDKPKEKIYKSFKTASQRLEKESKIDLSYSGSTLVGCYVCKDRIYCCNVGDSRAILGSKGQKDKTWSVWQLSTDHKPCLKSQADRIFKNQGRIDTIKDKQGNSHGPLRVWLKGQEAPGLAMTRSFGDKVAASVGVSWQPQIVEHCLTNSDRIIVVASDGVWQFLQNGDVINKLSQFYQKKQLEEACNYLLLYAKSRWTKESPEMVDDISFILIFLYHN